MEEDSNITKTNNNKEEMTGNDSQPKLFAKNPHRIKEELEYDENERVEEDEESDDGNNSNNSNRQETEQYNEGLD